MNQIDIDVRKTLIPDGDPAMNLKYLLFIFDGYRAEATNDHPENPYKPGSLEYLGWSIGQELALTDGLG